MDLGLRIVGALLQLFSTSPDVGTPRLTGDLSLVWDAPAGCPDADEVERRVFAELPADTMPSSRVRAHGIIAQDLPDGPWHLVLELDSDDGKIAPEAEAAECDALADAAAVQIALALKPEPREPEPEPEPPVPPTPTVTTAEAPPAAATPSVRGEFGAGGGIGFGVVPQLDGWLFLDGAALVPLRTRRFESWARIELLVGRAIASTQPIGGGSIAGVRVAAWWVGARGCWEPAVAGPRGPGFSFPLCVGPDLHAVVARGEGVVRSYQRARLAVAATAAASVIVRPIDRLGVRLGVETFVTALRPSFTIDNGAPLYTVGQFGVRGLLAIQVSLP